MIRNKIIYMLIFNFSIFKFLAKQNLTSRVPKLGGPPRYHNAAVGCFPGQQQLSMYPNEMGSRSRFSSSFSTSMHNKRFVNNSYYNQNVSGQPNY